MGKKTEDMQRFLMTVFLIALIGGVGGWIYELLFYRIDTGAFIKRGQGFGPWLPIYGFGVISFIVMTYKRKFHPVIVFLIGTIGSGIIEFVVGWALYTFFDGLRLWDYNVEIWNWGNIGGYVCLRSVLLFGVFGLGFYYYIIPKMFALTEKMEKKVLAKVTVPLAIIVFADLAFGYLIKPLLTILG